MNMTKRIGHTTYKVTVHYADTGTLSFEDRILRLIQNDVLANEKGCDIIGVSQTPDPLLERIKA